MEATDGAAWFGAVTGGLSFIASVLIYLDGRKTPVRQNQRALRAEVRADTETVLERIERSGKAARAVEPFDLPISSARPVLRWATDTNRFVSTAVSGTVMKHYVTLIKWDVAAHDYRLAFDEHQSEIDGLDRSTARPEQHQRADAANRKLTVATSALISAAEPAVEAIREIQRMLGSLDNRP